MSEELQPVPEMQEDPREPAKKWLNLFEAFVRKKDYKNACDLFHKNCVYYGLTGASIPLGDWESTWPKQQAFSIDLTEVKIIPEGNLMMCCCPWVARGAIVHRGDLTMGRITVALMRFKHNKLEEKLMCVHYHNSLKP